MSQIELTQLTKRFGAVTALNNIDLQIGDGEFVIMLGPNGAGKTTTLRCVAGLEKPETGKVCFDGVEVNKKSPAERNTAFVFQNYALYPRKTVFENITFPLEAHRLPRAEIEKRANEVADVLHIRHLMKRRPAQLSGGEQQRVALGRALVRKAAVFLMDEPLTNLDFKLRVEMRTELKRLHEEFRYTLLYVTNDQVEAMAMADKIAVLNKGVLQQVGSPRDVYDHPVNRIVAALIGFPTMNFLDCMPAPDFVPRLQAAGGGWHLPITQHILEKISAGGQKRLWLGIRPEDIQIGNEPNAGCLEGRVFISELLGDRTIVDVSLGETRVKVKASPTIRLDPGQPVWLTPNLNRIHVFDKTTDEAIL
ncbi:MAG: ABC transporter ATP-binding protein [Anaerolineaceae bacterium]|nr:ABC transporter ATP-binding protein [Anaerolineaceae bacterium]